jgi:hypothetical protein
MTASRALDAVIALARRNPISAMLIMAGAGWLVHRVRQEMAGSYSFYRRLEDEAGAVSVLNTGQARLYDPDVSPRHPTQDALESRREIHARV